MISRCKTILLTMFLLTSPYLLTAYGVKEGKKNIEPVGLQCEYLHNPSGLDIPHPRLSWKWERRLPCVGRDRLLIRFW